jgi:hypothetical protein
MSANNDPRNGSLNDAIVRHYARQQEGLPPLPPGYKRHTMNLRLARQHWEREHDPAYVQEALTQPRTTPSLSAEYQEYLDQRRAEAEAEHPPVPEGQLALPLLP